MPRASLQLFERNSGELRNARSDAEGNYIFRNLPEGTYLLEGQAAGAALASSLSIEVTGDAQRDLTLAVAGTEIEIVVTASSTPLTLQEVAKAMDIVNAEKLALRNEYSLAEALRVVPGVRVQQLRGPGSFATVQVRGMRAADTAVLVDGLRFRDAAAPHGDATGFLGVMDLVNTERVEVLRGSGSSLYGSHAVGGVTNIISSVGGGRPHGELRAEGGGLGMVRGVARLGGGLDGDRFTYSGGVSHLNVTEGHRGGSPYRNTSARGFAKHSFTRDISLSGRVWGSGAMLGAAESPTFTPDIQANFPQSGRVTAVALPEEQLQLFERRQPFAAGSATFIPAQLDPDGRIEFSYAAAAASLLHQLTPESSYRVSYQLVDTARSLQDGPAGPSLFDPAVSNDSRFAGQVHTVQARADHRIGARQLLSAGYEFEAETFLNFNTDESATPLESRMHFAQASHAAFAQDQIRLADGRLQLSLSGRAQHFSLGTPEFSGTAGPYEAARLESPGGALSGDLSAAYFLRSSQTKLRAHVGNSFRAPSPYERFGGSFSSFSGSFSYWGDPRLLPERAVAFDAGIDQWLGGSKLRLGGTFFYTSLQERVFFDFANFPAADDPFGRFGGYRNANGGLARGAEASAEITPGPGTSLLATYTYTNADSRQPTIGADYFEVPGTSPHLFSVVATQWIGKRLNLTFDFNAASSYVLSPYGALGRQMAFGGPVKADLVFRYDLPVAESKTLEFYGKAENVFDHEYYEDGFGAPGIWLIGGLRYRF